MFSESLKPARGHNLTLGDTQGDPLKREACGEYGLAARLVQLPTDLSALRCYFTIIVPDIRQARRKREGALLGGSVKKDDDSYQSPGGQRQVSRLAGTVSCDQPTSDI